MTDISKYLQRLVVIDTVDDSVGVMVLITLVETEYEDEVVDVVNVVGVVVVTRLVKLKKTPTVSYKSILLLYYFSYIF